MLESFWDNCAATTCESLTTNSQSSISFPITGFVWAFHLPDLFVYWFASFLLLFTAYLRCSLTLTHRQPREHLFAVFRACGPQCGSKESVRDCWVAVQCSSFSRMPSSEWPISWWVSIFFSSTVSSLSEWFARFSLCLIFHESHSNLRLNPLLILSQLFWLPLQIAATQQQSSIEWQCRCHTCSHTSSRAVRPFEWVNWACLSNHRLKSTAGFVSPR